jgi:hypothetical protein
METYTSDECRLIVSHNFYVGLGLGVIIGWLFSGIATFFFLAIVHIGKRKTIGERQQSDMPSDPEHHAED